MFRYFRQPLLIDFFLMTDPVKGWKTNATSQYDLRMSGIRLNLIYSYERYNHCHYTRKSAYDFLWYL